MICTSYDFPNRNSVLRVIVAYVGTTFRTHFQIFTWCASRFVYTQHSIPLGRCLYKFLAVGGAAAASFIDCLGLLHTQNLEIIGHLSYLMGRKVFVLAMHAPLAKWKLLSKYCSSFRTSIAFEPSSVRHLRVDRESLIICELACISNFRIWRAFCVRLSRTSWPTSEYSFACSLDLQPHSYINSLWPPLGWCLYASMALGGAKATSFMENLRRVEL